MARKEWFIALAAHKDAGLGSIFQYYWSTGLSPRYLLLFFHLAVYVCQVCIEKFLYIRIPSRLRLRVSLGGSQGKMSSGSGTCSYMPPYLLREERVLQSAVLVG